MTSVQTHPKRKRTVANQNLDVFMGLVISQHAKERNTPGNGKKTSYIRRS
jgi:hypothetical protein